MSDKSLRFQRFLSEQATCIYGPGWKEPVEKDVMEAAHRIHSLQVMDALRDAAITVSNRVSGAFRTSVAMEYLCYGAGRRLLMMWYAYRNVVLYTASPSRTKPLSTDESSELTRDLNVIYINIRGTLDNFASALLHEYAPEKLEKLKQRPFQIGLFKPCIIGDSRFAGLSLAIKEHVEWERDLADRRDPSAHRIPLAIPPQMLAPEDLSQYKELSVAFDRARMRLDFAEADRKLKAVESIGKFYPCFIHEMDKGLFPLYPTLPEDVAHLVEICVEVDRFFTRSS